MRRRPPRLPADGATGLFGASGKRLDAQMCHVWKVRDGKITSFQQFVDTAQLSAVKGA